MTKSGIGSSPRRREDQRLVTGAGTFGDDFTLPGQTFAAIVRRRMLTQSCRASKRAGKRIPGARGPDGSRLSAGGLNRSSTRRSQSVRPT